MNEFKKPIHSIDSRIAFCIGAGLAVIGFIFFFVFDVHSNSQQTFVQALNGAPFPLFVMLLYLMLAPLGLLAVALVKKEFSFPIAAFLLIFTLFAGTYYGTAGGFGLGSIFNLIIYFLLTVYALLRKGAPVEILDKPEKNIPMGNTNYSSTESATPPVFNSGNNNENGY